MPAAQRLFIFVVFATCLVVGISAHEYRSHYQHSQTATEDPHKQNDVLATQRPEDPVVLYTRWLAIFTAVLALATIVLVAATILLWRTTEGHAEHLEKSAQAAALAAQNMLRVSRPLCVMEDITLIPFEGAVPAIMLPEGASLMSLRGTIKNQGTSDGFARTMQVASTLRAGIGPLLIPQRVNEDAFVFRFGRLKAEESYETQSPIYQIPVSDDALAGHAGLFVWGWLRYADIHGVVRRSGFAFEWFAISDLVEGHFTPCGPSSYWYDIEEGQEGEKA
jgi:hypothetical protein